MALKPSEGNKDSQKKMRVNSNLDMQEFYLMEKLYQVMRDDKRRGKRPSAQEFYLMEKLYHTMVNDKNRNKKLLKSEN
ncbi:MAG: hypothetical protein ACE5RN_01655 [Nitrosopumilaceae archaeon]